MSTRTKLIQPIANFKAKHKSTMKNKLLIVAIIGVFSACGNGSESSTSADSTINSTTPPPTLDSTSEIGPMMSDTSTAVADSIK